VPIRKAESISFESLMHVIHLWQSRKYKFMINFFNTYLRKGEHVIMLNTSWILIGLVFTLLIESACAMEQIKQETQQQHFKFLYKKIFCELKTPPNNAKIGYLKEEGALFNKFFFQLIEHFSQEEKSEYAQTNDISQEYLERSAGKEFLKIETQYRKGTLLLATATDEFTQLQGAIFFYAQNNGTEVVIRSLILDSINNPDLFQKIYAGMTQVILKRFPWTNTITIFVRTVPDILKPTLQEYGFKYTVIKQWIDYNKKSIFLPISIN
jgi:hypothetical protein